MNLHWSGGKYILVRQGHPKGQHSEQWSTITSQWRWTRFIEEDWKVEAEKGDPPPDRIIDPEYWSSVPDHPA